MKTMRNAFLSAGLLVALSVSVAPVGAQTVSDIIPEISFSGQADVLLARRGGVAFAPSAGMPFNPRTDVPEMVEAYGYIQGGALFENEQLFLGGATPQNARFTFSVTNLVLDPTSLTTTSTPGPFGSITVNALFVGGTFEVFLDADAGGVPGDLQDFSNGSQGSFTDGQRILYGNIPFLQSSYSIPNQVRPSTLLLNGDIVFDTSQGSGPINQFLIDNPGVVSGFISSFGFSQTNPNIFGEFSTDGQTDLVGTLTPTAIPEPTTMALFGAGLLPLGAFLRRRRGA